MKSLLTSIGVAMVLATSTQSAAAEFAGTPITTENHADVLELVRIADTIDAAVDAKEWKLLRSMYTDKVSIDFSSLGGGEPTTIPADALVSTWSSNLTQEKTSFHLRGNHRVTFTGADSATMLSNGYAWNQMASGALDENGGNPFWEVWGTYEHRFTRTSDGWKLSFLGFFATAQRGNEFVRDTPGQ